MDAGEKIAEDLAVLPLRHGRIRFKNQFLHTFLSPISRPRFPDFRPDFVHVPGRLPSMAGSGKQSSSLADSTPMKSEIWENGLANWSRSAPPLKDTSPKTKQL